MSEIPTINWIDFQKIVNSGRVSDLKSCEIWVNEEHRFTAIIFHGDKFSTDYVRTQAEYLGVKANISGGKTPAEVLGSLEPELTLRDKRVLAMAHAREARRAKREMVKV